MLEGIKRKKREIDRLDSTISFFLAKKVTVHVVSEGVSIEAIGT